MWNDVYGGPGDCFYKTDDVSQRFIEIPLYKDSIFTRERHYTDEGLNIKVEGYAQINAQVTSLRTRGLLVTRARH